MIINRVFLICLLCTCIIILASKESFIILSNKEPPPDRHKDQRRITQKQIYSRTIQLLLQAWPETLVLCNDHVATSATSFTLITPTSSAHCLSSSPKNGSSLSHSLYALAGGRNVIRISISPLSLIRLLHKILALNPRVAFSNLKILSWSPQQTRFR